VLVDVGFGDAFTRPLPLDGRWRRDGRKLVRIARRDGRWCYEEDMGEGPRPSYDFTEVPRSLDEFTPRNEWQQTSPDSHFTAGSVCSILTPTHRFTLSGPGLGRRLITTDNASGQRSERALAESDVSIVLNEMFGIDLSAVAESPNLV
jgi:N-hydroxyarylamine O-acetyltransferase